ncbi:MAG: hypothetical protein QXT45_08175 [Candidatus Bilamarchaeaceae archaeon]
MTIERDPTSVATGGIAGLLGTTFSPIPPTPTDTQRRLESQTQAAPSGQIVSITSFKPTAVTQLPTPLLVRPETVGMKYFRGRTEEEFGPGTTVLDRVLNRIAEIIREQVEQYASEQYTSVMNTTPDAFPTPQVVAPPQSGQPSAKTPPTTTPFFPREELPRRPETPIISASVPPDVAPPPPPRRDIPPPPQVVPSLLTVPPAPPMLHTTGPWGMDYFTQTPSTTSQTPLPTSPFTPGPAIPNQYHYSPFGTNRDLV